MKNVLSTLTAIEIRNAINNAKATVKDRPDAEVKKTELYKQAVKDRKICKLVWDTEFNIIKNSNSNLKDEDVEEILVYKGFDKPETDDELLARIKGEFRRIDEAEAVANATDEINAYAEIFDEEPTPSAPTSQGRTYYTARDQYEDHRSITLANRANKRGASAAERFDSNMNAFSEHLEIFARRFKR